MIQDQFLHLLNQDVIFNKLIDSYRQQKQFIINKVISYFSNIISFGPIALFNAEQICSSKQTYKYVSQLRKNYEMLLGLNENLETQQSFIDKTKENFTLYFTEQFDDNAYQQFLQDLQEKPYIKSISKTEWLEQLSQIVEISTIQEINYTILNEQFESDTQIKDRKSISNYDGDEEKTPHQSEEDEQYKNTYQKNKKEKDLVGGEGGEEGYEASNSDHKTKSSKILRRLMQRRKQGNNKNQEFDTDREMKQKE